MNLVSTDLKFGELICRRITRRIVIHHSASPDVPAAEIHRWHLQRGWSGIGYHFVIRRDGTIEKGRPLETVGAHAGPDGNSDSIAVCLTGDFTKYPPSEVQISSLINLTRWLKDLYPSELAVVRHCDICATECPGQLFPWDSFLASLTPSSSWKEELMDKALSAGLMFDQHDPDEPAPKWFVTALVLNLLDLIMVNDKLKG